MPRQQGKKAGAKKAGVKKAGAPRVKPIEKAAARAGALKQTGISTRSGRTKVPTSPEHVATPCFMVATNNGGRLERVPGYDSARVMSQNMGRTTIARPYCKRSFASATSLEYDVPQLGTLNDERARIIATSEVPWRSICQLLIEGMHPQLLLGTGWLAGPNTIVTAGHNIISPSSNARAQRIHVFPGRNADTAPFGQYHSSDFNVHARWADERDVNYDFGVIRLQDPVGRRAGWFGMSALDDAALQDKILNNAGYPSDQSRHHVVRFRPRPGRAAQYDSL